TGEISRTVQRVCGARLLAIRLWCERFELLRKLLQRARLWPDVAALPCRRRLGSIHEWSLDVVSRRRVYVGLLLSLGMDALSLWLLDLPRGWLVLAARKFLGGMEHSSCNHEPTP